MTPDQLRRAALLLTEYAQELMAGHTINGEWPDEDADVLKDFDEMLALARLLREEAERNP